MEKVKAEINIYVHATCPHCEEGVDILQAPSANERAEILKEVCSTNGHYDNWGHSDLDIEFECTECGGEFTVGRVDW